MPRSTDSSAATGEAVEEASAVKPGGGREDGVAMGHPAGLAVGQAGEEPAGLAHGELRAPELPDLGALDRAAELRGDELHAVADAEHRDAELEQLAIQARRARRVDRRRTAGEDEPLRLAAADLLGPDVVGQQLAEDAELAHPAGDELRVLTAVVEDDDLVDGARRRDLAHVLDDELRRRGRGGHDAVRHVSLRMGSWWMPLPLEGSAGGGAAAAEPRAPMPTPCATCSCLPSVWSAGAIMSSARLNSAMSL